MKPNDKEIKKIDLDLKEYYDPWFDFWYDMYGDELPTEDHWNNWYEYMDDQSRIRQEKLNQIFDIDQPCTIEEVLKSK